MPLFVVNFLNISHKSNGLPARPSYGAYYVGSNSAFVIAVMHAISCYIGQRLKGTPR